MFCEKGINSMYLTLVFRVHLESNIRRHSNTPSAFSGAAYGLRLVLNIEQFENIRGASLDAGVKVSVKKQNFQRPVKVCVAKSVTPPVKLRHV